MKKAQSFLVYLLLGMAVLIAVFAIIFDPLEAAKTWIQGLPGQDTCQEIDVYVSSINKAVDLKDKTQAEALFTEFSDCYPSDVQKYSDLKTKIDNLS